MNCGSSSLKTTPKKPEAKRLTLDHLGYQILLQLKPSLSQAESTYLQLYLTLVHRQGTKRHLHLLSRGSSEPHLKGDTFFVYPLGAQVENCEQNHPNHKFWTNLFETVQIASNSNYEHILRHKTTILIISKNFNKTQNGPENHPSRLDILTN